MASVLSKTSEKYRRIEAAMDYLTEKGIFIYSNGPLFLEIDDMNFRIENQDSDRVDTFPYPFDDIKFVKSSF